jgi:hypothetical protein
MAKRTKADVMTRFRRPVLEQSIQEINTEWSYYDRPTIDAKSVSRSTSLG